MTVNYGVGATASKGIWWVDYELYDVAGNIVQAQSEGERFAVAVSRTEGVQPGAWQMWTTSSDSYVAKGSDVVLTVNVKNNSTTDIVNGSIVIGAHQARAEGGAWFVNLTSIANVTIPAGSQQSFNYTTRIDYSSSFYFYLFDRYVGGVPYFPEIPAGLVTSCERGVWVVPANVATTISVDKAIYVRGDTANISVNLNNLQSASYTNLSAQVRILIQAIQWFNQSFTNNLSVNSQVIIIDNIWNREALKMGVM